MNALAPIVINIPPAKTSPLEDFRRDVLLALREANCHPDRIAGIPVFREHLRRYHDGGCSREGFKQHCRLLKVINPSIEWRPRQPDVVFPAGWYDQFVRGPGPTRPWGSL